MFAEPVGKSNSCLQYYHLPIFQWNKHVAACALTSSAATIPVTHFSLLRSLAWWICKLTCSQFCKYSCDTVLFSLIFSHSVSCFLVMLVPRLQGWQHWAIHPFISLSLSSSPSSQKIYPVSITISKTLVVDICGLYDFDDAMTFL